MPGSEKVFEIIIINLEMIIAEFKRRNVRNKVNLKCVYGAK